MKRCWSRCCSPSGIPKGIGQGQIAAYGALARTNTFGGATVFPAEISIPDEIAHE